MKVRLLIATEDTDYSNYLSEVLRSRYADMVDPYLCSTVERAADALEKNHYHVGLFSPSFAREIGPGGAELSLILWDERNLVDFAGEQWESIRKYQRISSIMEDVLERYARIAKSSGGLNENNAHITLVWSPAGGTGKTTVALAYAAQCVAREKKTLYLNLEFFSSSSIYFANDGKSISEAFEKMSGNRELLLQSIRRQDRGSGIYYFCSPNNYDDINALTEEDIEDLIRAVAQGMDELVVDLPSICDGRCANLMRLAQRILIVTDGSRRSKTKWEQFQTQHNTFEMISDKITLVGNKGVQLRNEQVNSVVLLPYINSDNPVSIYKSLSATELGA